MNTKNPRIKDFIEAYNNIKDNIGVSQIHSDVDLSGSGGHIQGIATYYNFRIISHSEDSNRKGYLLIYWLRDYLTKVEVPETNHPGGIQIIGDILVVPVEDTASSIIYFYRLDKMTETNPIPERLPYSFNRNNKRCGGVGITNFTSDNKELYLLATYDSGNIDLYVTQDFPGSNWEQKGGTYNCTESGYSEICLLTDVNQTVYMIGFRTENIPNTAEGYNDYMDIFKINTNDWRIEPLNSSRHMHCNHKRTKGMFGVHFRWGAGIDIQVYGSWINVYVTERNLGNHETDYIIF
jgi:hypothetical protein